MVTVVGLVNFVATRVTAGAFRATALRLEKEAEVLARLRTDIVSIALLRSAGMQGLEVDRVQLQAAAAAEQASFARAIRTLRPGGGREVTQRHLELARALWPKDVAITALSPSEFSAKVARGQQNFAMIDEAAAASRTQARADLTGAADLERNMTLLTGLLGILVIALTVRFGRRLSNEVLGPVARLRDSANRLAEGDLEHRVEVTRADEIGDLAATFNAMADVIAGRQVDLTLQASRDPLTGLANRAAFQARLEEALDRRDRRDGTQAVLFVDLDDFKHVNDRLGHAAGDALLCAVATRLVDAVRPGDLVARHGGDEFTILLDGVSERAVATSIAERAVAALAAPVQVSGTWVHVGASVGLAMRRDGSDAGTLMSEADIAMYGAKGRGKNRVESYDAGSAETVTDRHAAAG